MNCNERGVDLVGLLLLHPVAGAVDEHVASMVGERVRAKFSGGVMSSTGSSLPPMNSDGTSTLAPATRSVSVQLRSMLRYQLMPPVKPVRVNSST